MRIVLLAAGLLAAGSCAKSDADGHPNHGAAAPAPVPEPSRPKPDRSGPPARVVFELGGGKEEHVDVEVVRTQRDIRRGLMYRTFLPPDAGMLFLFHKEKMQSFWMKNTLIPLDMIFIHADRTIAGIVENAEPRTTTSRFVRSPSQYVLEVNGGWTAKHGVKAGQKVRFENVGPVPKGVPLGSAPGGR